MPSQREACLRPIALAMVVAGTISLRAVSLEDQSRQEKPESPGEVEMVRAIERVKADPNLATERTITMLRWKNPTEVKPSTGMPAWLKWIADLFRWLEQSARVLVWCAAVMLAGMLVVYITRIVRRYRTPRGVEQFVAPTHVRDLDIRPESLPEDIGAAARALWDSGEHRAALALLYRGLLSRLAHVHRVPIRDSSTEGDCLVLAASHLVQGKHEYVSRLVRVWQRAVYGREDVPPATVYVLCEHFASALDAASALDPAASGGTR